MKLVIEIDEKTAQDLWNKATLHGFQRVEPKKRWTEKEKKEAIRWEINRRLL